MVTRHRQKTKEREIQDPSRGCEDGIHGGDSSENLPLFRSRAKVTFPGEATRKGAVIVVQHPST